MDLDKHCNLCENQILDNQIGTLCKLTNVIPNFNKVCSSILLKEKFDNKLREVIVDYERIKKSKKSVYSNSIFLGIVAITIILLGFILAEIFYEYNAFSKMPYITLGVGLLFLYKAFAPLNSYLNSYNAAKNKVEAINELLEGYKIRYEYKINSWNYNFGIEKVDIEFSFKGREFMVPII